MTDTAVKTPQQAKIAADAESRAADKARADAQVVEDAAVLDAAKAAATAAHDAKVKAEQAAYDAVNAAADAKAPPAANPADAAAVAAYTAAVAENTVLAQAAIQTHGAAKAAAEVSAKADEALVAARDRWLASVAAADKFKAVSTTSPWYYCLQHTHSGDLKSALRFFQSDDPGCPVCPQCKVQVSAASVSGFGVYPPGIIAVAERLGGRV
jgi:hypothetical protein